MGFAYCENIYREKLLDFFPDDDENGNKGNSNKDNYASFENSSDEMFVKKLNRNEPMEFIL